MEMFNKAIMDYACCDDLWCNVIDMNGIFEMEMQHFHKDIDRFMKTASRDPYRVFSDCRRKVFISTLRSCLIQQVESGH